MWKISMRTIQKVGKIVQCPLEQSGTLEAPHNAIKQWSDVNLTIIEDIFNAVL